LWNQPQRHVGRIEQTTHQYQGQMNQPRQPARAVTNISTFPFPKTGRLRNDKEKKIN